MKELQLQVTSPGRAAESLTFQVRQMINLGYTGRNQAAVKAHIEELQREGVAPPPSVPLCLPVLTQNITTDEQIEVVGGKTSGEAEVVFFVGKSETYVGVGSDHTDRELEAHSILKSKQVCANVVSKEVWRFEELSGRWDELLLQSFVQVPGSTATKLYQKSPLSALLPPSDLFQFVRSKIGKGFGPGLVVYSGTVPIQHGETNFGPYFRSELVDQAQKQSLTSAYSIREIGVLS